MEVIEAAVVGKVVAVVSGLLVELVVTVVDGIVGYLQTAESVGGQALRSENNVQVAKKHRY